MLKKTIITIGIIALAVAGYLTYNSFTANEFGAGQKTADVSVINPNDDIATTSVTYLYTEGSPSFVASSTWSFEASRIDETDRRLIAQWQASSTDSSLAWTWETSQDNIEWYKYQDESSNVFTAQEFSRAWTGTASSTMYASTTDSGWNTSYINYFDVSIPAITASYLRLTFWETGATSSIYWALPHRDIGE